VQFKNTNQTSVLDNSGSVGFAMGSDIAILTTKAAIAEVPTTAAAA
jgi:hypothetical protein